MLWNLKNYIKQEKKDNQQGLKVSAEILLTTLHYPRKFQNGSSVMIKA